MSTSMSGYWQERVDAAVAEDPDLGARVERVRARRAAAAARPLDRPAPPLSVLLKRSRGEALTEPEEAEWRDYERDFEGWEARERDLGLVDLAAVMEEGVRPPEMLVQGLVVEGVHHIVYGKKESAKTWLVLACAVMVMANGRGVLWVDEEMGRGAFAERLACMGATPDMVRDHLVYSEFAAFDASAPHRALWAALLAHHRPALVVVDAHTEVLATADLNENSGTDVSKWHMAYMAPALAVGATTLVIDHTGHEEQGRAAGSRHKGAQSKVELAVVRAREFDRDMLGSIEVRRTKNTCAAAIPERQAFQLGGDGRGGFTFEPATAEAGPDRGAQARAELKGRILATLADREGLGVNQLHGMLGGNKSKLGDALRELVADGLVAAEPSGRSLLHSLTGQGAAVATVATGRADA